MIAVGTTVEGLAGKYLCEAEVGAGGFDVLWRGKRESDGAEVVLEELRVERLRDWKALELFEREAAALKRLKPAGLAEKVAAGARLGPAEATKILRGLLDILVYLHELHPPVVRRDITPANVIVRADGSPVLIDFGTDPSFDLDIKLDR